MNLRKLSRQLVEKSENAFLLALEIYNKPTVHYRLESFCILYINSWELLLKAKIIENNKDTKSIFVKGTKKKDTITFSEALGRVFTNVKDPLRVNLEHINELRNTSSHLIIPEYENIYAGLFQQGVLNYTNTLLEWFEKTIDITPRLLTLTFDYHPENVTKLTIKDKYNQLISAVFDIQQKNILNTLKSIPQGYSIPINSTLALVKNPEKADIVFSQGRKEGKELLGYVEVPKDSSKTHPYLRGKDKFPKKDSVLGVLKSKGININGYELQCINYCENINSNSRVDFIFINSVANNSTQYSVSYVEFIENKIMNNPNYIEKCKEKYKKKSNK